MNEAKGWETVKPRPGTPERAENITRALRVIGAEVEKMSGEIDGDIHLEPLIVSSTSGSYRASYVSGLMLNG
jgi:hypothetical protein